MNVIAVDVGTTSVRLAIISFIGEQASQVAILASHTKDIEYHQDGSRFEQSSKNIWEAICECSKKCIQNSKISLNSIRSIAFSATCSLVVLDRNESGCDCNDVIMWMDHRAIDEAVVITDSQSHVLKQFGGVCSPEFSLPKLCWIKKNQPQRFKSAKGFFELPDWLVYQCIGGEPGSCPRSLCCVTCKWGYNVESQSHCDIVSSLDPEIGVQIGHRVLGPGTVAGYLSEAAAIDLGLAGKAGPALNGSCNSPLIAVGTSLIDAHAGMLAMLSVSIGNCNIENQAGKIESTLCSLVGTSSCHMLLSRASKFTPGFWGPYKDVVIKDYYLLEAGQTLSGRLIEIIIESHEEGKRLLQSGEKMYDIIRNLDKRALSTNSNEDLHLLPSFHGNRSPLANPRLKGGIYGLTAEDKSLLDYYRATVEALTYETKFIMEKLNAKLDLILVSGGLMKSHYYMQTLADVLKCKVLKVGLEGIDLMLLGSGLVARHAALNIQNQTHLPLTGESLGGFFYQQLEITTFQPVMPITEDLSNHEKRYLCYKEFVDFSQKVDKIIHPNN